MLHMLFWRVSNFLLIEGIVFGTTTEKRCRGGSASATVFSSSRASPLSRAARFCWLSLWRLTIKDLGGGTTPSAKMGKSQRGI